MNRSRSAESPHSTSAAVAATLLRCDFTTPVDLVPGLKLKLLSPEEYSLFFPGVSIQERSEEGWVTEFNVTETTQSGSMGHGAIYPETKLLELQSSEYALELTSNEGTQKTQIKMEVINRLMALCFGRGSTWFMYKIYPEHAEGSRLALGTSYAASRPVRLWARPLITLDDVAEFSRCYQSLERLGGQISELFNVGLALDYFLYASSEIGRPNDIRPLFYFSILNLLLCPEVESVYKIIKVRGSALLGISRSMLYRLLEKRGRLAHAGINEFSSQDLDEFESITRQAVIKSILRPEELAVVRRIEVP